MIIGVIVSGKEGRFAHEIAFQNTSECNKAGFLKVFPHITVGAFEIDISGICSSQRVPCFDV